MAGFLNLVRLVTGMGESNPVTSSPGRSFTKWVFLDEEGEIDKGQEQAAQDLESASAVSLEKTEQTAKVHRDCIMEDLEADGADGANNASTSTTKKSKNQKKKAKKKNRSRSNSTLSADSAHNKTVTWGVVEEVLFLRDQGLGSVPSSGLYPLGFGAEESPREVCSVAQHVSASQVRLIQRAQRLGIILSDSSNSDSSMDPEYKALETRQYCHRSGTNPLFHSSTEEERILLLGDSARPRSRSRSSSFSLQSQGGGGGEDEMTVHTVNESNKELIDIRKSRQTSPGCSCKAVKVDKLSVTKLKQELIQHQDKLNKSVNEINAMSKADLITTVRDVLQSCPLCISNSCSCVEEGIGCHIEVCCCFKHNNLQVCANELNAPGYSSSTVNAHRKKYITSSYNRCRSGSDSGGNSCSCSKDKSQ